jgi:hypothetical protein
MSLRQWYHVNSVGHQSAPSQPFTFSPFYPTCSFLLPAIKVSEVSIGLHHSFLKQDTAAAQYSNTKQGPNQGCTYFPEIKILQFHKHARSKFHPQTLGLIIHNSVAMVTWHLGFVHLWAKLLYKWTTLPSFISVSVETGQTIGGTTQVLKYMFSDSIFLKGFPEMLKK